MKYKKLIIDINHGWHPKVMAIDENGQEEEIRLQDLSKKELLWLLSGLSHQIIQVGFALED